jgi:hypothetical protein
MQLGFYHNHDARPSTNQSEGWCCPICHNLSKGQQEIRQTESKIRLVNWELNMGSSKDDQIQPKL